MCASSCIVKGVNGYRVGALELRYLFMPLRTQEQTKFPKNVLAAMSRARPPRPKNKKKKNEYGGKKNQTVANLPQFRQISKEKKKKRPVR